VPTGTGVDAALVRVESFDEALRDLMRLMSGIDTKVIDTKGGTFGLSVQRKLLKIIADVQPVIPAIDHRLTQTCDMRIMKTPAREPLRIPHSLAEFDMCQVNNTCNTCNT